MKSKKSKSKAGPQNKKTLPGRLNVFANDLSTGIYNYSVIIDGKIVDTKKMIKTK